MGVVLAAFGALTTFKGLLLLVFISGFNFFTLLSGYHYLGGGEGGIVTFRSLWYGTAAQRYQFFIKG